jgi:hypothetical protein
MAKLNSNKGIILITTFMVSAVLFVLSGVYMSSSMVQNWAAQREKGTTQAFYAAEQGMQYAFIEAQNHGYKWSTHYVKNVPAKDLEIQTTAPAISLTGAKINASGCYEVSTPSGTVEVKAYPDPLRPDETILLSRGIDPRNVTSRIIKYRISRKSLYKNFMFWPVNFSASGSFNGKAIDGKPIGSLHINGNISLDSGTIKFSNFSRISCSGNIYYYNNKFDKPYDLDVRAWNPSFCNFESNVANLDGIAPLSRSTSAPYDFSFPSRGLFQNPSTHFYGNDRSDDWTGANDITESGWWTVNGKEIPKQLPDNPTSWSWPKYSGARAANEKAVRFEVTNTALQWLVNAEEKAGEYSVKPSSWLNAGADGNSNGLVDDSEGDKVTLLAVNSEGSFWDSFDGQGLSKGLRGFSEYEIYSAVKSFEDSGGSSFGTVFPGSGHLYDDLKDWIANTLKDRQGYLSWWKSRQYHHKAKLQEDVGVYHFESDAATVPAVERIFWEAWLNYWPPAHGKVHTEVLPLVYSSYRTLNPEWWQDLRYGDDRSLSDGTNIEVKYLNTQYQSTEFQSWLQTQSLGAGQTLADIIKFNVPPETPLAISACYASPAQNNGLYIKENSSAGTFTVAYNGIEETRSSLAGCLAALGISDWVSTTQFYNSSTTTADYVTTPVPIQAIQIDVEMLRKQGNINNHIIYIESPTYDTRLVNGATLPEGGFTVVSPYDVYIKAQQKSIDGKPVNAFNYEAADKIKSGDGVDTNWQPAALITNSRVYFLSSQYKDFDAALPYPAYFPVSTTNALFEPTFLKEYCWNNWPTEKGYPSKPAQASLDWGWVNSNLSATQQQSLLTAGNNQWAAVNTDAMPNKVTLNNSFNVGVASAEDPRGNVIERWQSGTSLNVEGSFIKLKDKFAPDPGKPTVMPYRLHYDYGKFEKERFKLVNASAGTRAYSSSVAYEYEERFWESDSRPSADFFTGSQQRWEEVSDFYHDS